MTVVDLCVDVFVLAFRLRCYSARDWSQWRYRNDSFDLSGGLFLNSRQPWFFSKMQKQSVNILELFWKKIYTEILRTIGKAIYSTYSSWLRLLRYLPPWFSRQGILEIIKPSAYWTINRQRINKFLDFMPKSHKGNMKSKARITTAQVWKI